jgi:hypothetical protein
MLSVTTRRLAKVAVGLILGSAAVGALAGIACAAVLLVMSDGLAGLLADEVLYRGAAIVGASCGVLLGPAASFGFMRRVPLGRLFAETALGAVIAGVLGFLLPVSFEVGLGIAAAGFILAAARVGWVYRSRPQQKDLPSAG